MVTKTVNDGKTMAIIAYLWWIGLLISFILNSSKRNSFASFHIRQALGLVVLNFFILLLLKYEFHWIASIISIIFIILWVLGIVSAIQGEKKSIPFVGDYFQDWFKGIG